jgi:autotransporter-associated beta strand protein
MPSVNPRRAAAWLALCALAPMLLAGNALAQSLYWDINGATAGSGGPSPSGTWDATTANWNASSAGTLLTVPWIPGSTAIFSAGADATGSYTITLSGTQTAGGVTLKDGTPTLTGGTLSLNAASLISVGIGKSATISSTITGSGSWTNNAAGGTLTLSGANTITGPLTILGGKIRFDSNTAAGVGAILVSPTNDVFIQNSVSATTLTNSITLNSGHNLDISALSGTLTLNGSIGGTRTLWTVGGQAANTVVLGTSNYFQGNVELQSGTLLVKADSALGDISGTTTIDSGATLGVQGGFTYGEPESVSLSGNGVGSLGSVRSLSGVNVFKGSLSLQTSTTIGVDGDSLELTRGISGPGLAITKVGSGGLIISGSPNNYGATIIAGGTVQVNTTLGIGTVTVNSGTTLAGDGTVSGSVALSGTISPGASPGELTTGPETWNGDASYVWEINDADFGAAGSGVGWDLVNITGGAGTLSITATAAHKFTIHLNSLDPFTDLPAPADDFENTAEYSFTIAHTTGGITGFDPTAFVLDTSGFQNPLGNGVFILQQSGNDLVLRFVQKPQIATGPVSQLIHECQPVTFTVSATGTAPLSYQWFHGASLLAGATSSSFSIGAVAPTDAGIYTVVVSNVSTFTASASATLTVDDPPPVISGCPANILTNTGPGHLTCDQVVTWTPPTATDNCSVASTNSNRNPGDVFPVGTSTVTYTFTDNHGHQSVCSFQVAVQDTTPPVALCKNITVALDNSGQVSITPAQVDNGSADNCLITNRTVAPNHFTCSNLGSNSVTLTVTDSSGNSSSCNATVTVVDTTSPTVLTKNIIVPLVGSSATITAAQVDNGSTDNCSITNRTVTPSSFTCANLGTNIVQLIVTDESGNKATNTAFVTIVDTTPPVAVCQNITLALDGTGHATITGSQVNNGSTDNCTITNYSVTPNQFTCANLGSNFVTLTVTDESGNSASCGATVTVIDNLPPAITCPPDVIVTTSQDKDPYFTGTATATDNCSGTITITYDDVRSGLTNCDTTGQILRTWTAVDASENTNTCVQTITVIDTNVPYFTVLSTNITVPNDPGLCSAVVNYVAPLAKDLGYFQGFEDPAWVSGPADTSPSTDWNSGPSTVLRVISGTDGITSKSGTAHAVIDSTGITPRSNVNDGGNTTGAFGRLGGYSAVFGTGYRAGLDVYLNLSDAAVTANTYGFDLDTAASDNTGGFLRDFIFHVASNPAHHLLVAADNNSNFAKREDLATINHYEVTASGWYTFEWVFRNNAGVLAVDCNLRDATGALLFTETRSDPGDLIPSVAGGHRYMWFTFVTPDRLPIDNTILERNVPVGTSIASGSAFSVGTSTVSCTATDACGNITNTSFTVTVNDTEPPSANCPANVVLNNDLHQCGAIATFTVPNQTDNCAVASAVVTPLSGTFFPVGTNPVHVVVTDIHGNTNSCTFSVIVNDTELPTITAPTDVSVANSPGLCANTNVTLGTPVTHDNCGVASVTNNAPATFPVGTTIVTWTVTDVHGNSATATQNVTVLDQQPPTVVCQPVSKTLTGADTQVTVSPSEAFDAVHSSDNCGVVTPISLVPDTFYCAGTYTVTLTATDGHGNNNTCQTTVTVIDNRAPPNAVYVDAGYGAMPNGTPVAFPNGVGPLSHLIGCDAFATVQGGVNRVASSGTVNVAAGTYAENVVVAKSLHLLGANAGVDPRTSCHLGPARGPEAIIDGGGLDAAVAILENHVTVDGFTLRGGGLANNNHNGGVWMYAGVQDDHVLNNVLTANDRGVAAASSGASSIRTNLITANNQPGPAGGAGIDFYASDTNLTVADNEFTGHTNNNPILLEATAVDLHNGLLVTRNNIHDNSCGCSAVYALGVTGGTFSENQIAAPGVTGIRLGSGNSGVAISNNLFLSADVGVRVVDDTGGSFPANSNVTIHGNSFGTMGSFAVAWESGYAGPVLDASGNWWGVNTVAGVQSKIDNSGGPVDFTPWLDNGTSLLAGACAGFQGDFSVLDVSADSPQSGTGGRIQEGINLIADGSLTAGSRMLNVLPGTYSEKLDYRDIWVNKSLKLLGTGRAGLTTINGNAQYMVLIDASDVTMDGFTVTDPTYSTGGFGGDGTGIYVNWQTPLSNVHVKNCVVHDLGDRIAGLSCGSGPNLEIDHCTVYNINGYPTQTHVNDYNDFSVGIWVWDDGLISANVHDNTVHDIFPRALSVGINLSYNVANATVLNNHVTLDPTCTSGIRLSSSLLGGPVDITGNTVSGSQYGLMLLSPFDQFANGNHITGAGTSIYVSSSSATLKSNSASTGSGIGIWVSGATAAALIESNTLVGDSVAAIKVDGGATVDAGDCSDSDVTGLATGSLPNGSSAGGNIMTGYLTGSAKAVLDLNGAGDPDVLAHANDYGQAAGDIVTAALSDLGPGNSRILATEQGALNITCPSATVQCSQLVPPGVVGSGVTAFDAFFAQGGKAWANDGTISFADGPLTPGPFEGTITRTYSITDACGQMATCMETITVHSTHAPIITQCATNRTLDVNGNCTVVVPDLTGEVMATDTNCGHPILSVTQHPPAGTSVSLGTTNVTLTVTDQGGNPAMCVAVLTIIDTTPPGLTCPPNVTVTTLQAKDPYFTGTATASDNCSGSITITYDDVRAGLTNCDTTGQILRTWTAVDASHNTNTCVQTITVIDTNAPYFAFVPANIATTNDPGLCSAVVNYPAPLAKDLGYFQGFEDSAWVSGPPDTQPSTDWNSGPSTVLRVPSGTDGIASKSGIAHAVIDSTGISPRSVVNDGGNTTGAFGRLGGYSAVFGTGYRAGLDVYLNLSDAAVTANTYGFDLDTAASDNTGGFLRDFIFHVASNPAHHLLVAADNNSNFAKREDLATINHYEVTASGWYTFEWVFRNNAGVLAVDCNLRDAAGALLFTETRSDPGDLIPSVAGGHRYMWFTFVTPDRLPIDNTILERNVPVGTVLASGSAFPVGTSTVSCTATDACGNITNTSFTVTVNDTEPPSANCLADIVVPNTPGLCSAVVDFTLPLQTDNCGVANTNATPPSGSTFLVGTNPVHVVVTDIHGNTNTCTFNVVVLDTEPPSAICPADVVVNNDPGQCSAVVHFNLPAQTDNCGVATTIATPPSGTTFPVGTTPVTVVVTDIHGNTNSCTFHVTVNDTEPPSANCLADVVANNDPGQCSAVVHFTLPAQTDNCAVATTVATPPSGSTFPVGTTAVHVVVTDIHGNTNTCAFNVIVHDTEPPVITLPPDAVVQCDQPKTPAQTGQATAVDNCGGSPTITFADSSPLQVTASGQDDWATRTAGTPLTGTATFVNGPGHPPLGTGSLRLAVGSNGDGVAEVRNSAYAGTRLSDLTEIAYDTYRTQDGSGGQDIYIILNLNASGTGSTTDDQLFFEPVYQTHASGNPSLPDQGPTVTGVWQHWNALVGGWWSANGDLNPGTGVGSLGDYLALHPNAKIINDVVNGGGFRFATGEGAPDWNNWDGSLDAVVIGTNGVSTAYDFELTPGTACANTYIVRTWEAGDAHGNHSFASQLIHVIDTVPPVITVPATIVADNDPGQCSAVVTFTPTAADACDPNPLVVSAPPSGSAFPVGTNTVTVTATDACGNSTNKTFTVVVLDTEPPSANCLADVVANNDPGLCSAVVNFTLPLQTDNCAVATTVATPPSGSTFLVGTTAVNVVVTDIHGNTNSCAFNVIVHDTEPPSAICPANVVVNNDLNQCGAVVIFSLPGQTDNCAVASTVATPPSGSFFPVGTNPVHVVVTDIHGNSNSCTFNVVVHDTQPPSIACPHGIVIKVDQGQNYATVNFSVAAGDNCPGVIVTTAPFHSGDHFPVGTNAVTATATDAAGNTNSCAFTVAVIPLPTIVSQPQSRTNNAGTTAPFTVVASAPDPITYQWYKNATNILTDVGNVSGSTSNILTLTNVLGADRAAYTVVVANLAGSVTSAPALLAVIDPTILAQPVSVSNNLGSSVSFSVSAYGTATLKYQWQQDGTSLPGATSSTLNISGIVDSDAGNYTVIVTNTAGAITSAPALLYIFHPPVFVSQPTNENVILGHSAVFDVSLNGRLPFSYQWQKNNSDIPGATTKTFSIPSVAVSDAGLYRIVVTNVDGSATSSNATLNVIVPPNITSQPQGLTNNAGTTATFTVTNTSNPAAYRWFKNGTNALSDAGKLSGSATPVLTISNVLGADTAFYSVVVSNAGGVLTSSNAFLLVIDPIITNPPTSITTNLGSSVTFSVGAYGTTPKYQWQKNSGAIAGATVSTFSIASVADADAAAYTVVVSNAFGVVTSAPPAILTVIDPPIITNQPVSITRNAGQTATFTVGASGTAPTYQWRKGLVPLSDAGNISGSATATLTITGVSDSDATNYSVVVSNPAGTQTSLPATLTVIDPPVITQQPASRTNNATTTATFTVLASGSPATYQWYKNGTNLLVNGGKISGSTSNVLAITNVLGADRGAYTVVLSNPAGTVTSAPPALLTVIDPFITVQPMGVTNVDGSDVTFSVTAVGTAPLRYQWAFDGTPMTGETNSTLFLDSIADSDSGNYTVVVTNISGSVTSAPAFLQTFPPLIVQQPTNQIAFPGENVSFSVSVNGQTPFTYQWQKDGTNISGANARILNLPSVAFSDDGNYRVIVSNPLGTETSDYANLFVTDRPWLDITKIPAGNAILTVHGFPGSNAVLQASTDFVSWVSLKTNVVTYTFTDTNAPGIPARFYRAYYVP